MIIPVNITKENPFYRNYKKVETIYNKFYSQTVDIKIGRPKKYSDLQIIKCQLYKVMNKIYCLRELEWELNKDPFFLFE